MDRLTFFLALSAWRYTRIHTEFRRCHNLQHGLVHTHTLSLAPAKTEERADKCTLPDPAWEDRRDLSPGLSRAHTPSGQWATGPTHVQLNPEAAFPAFLLRSGESGVSRKGDLFRPAHGNTHSRRLSMKGTLKVTIPFAKGPPKSLKLKVHYLYTTHHRSPWYVLRILPQHLFTQSILVLLPKNRCQIGSLAMPQIQ